MGYRINADDSITVIKPYLLTCGVRSDATRLGVTADADFTPAQTSFTANQQAVAAHLEELWRSSPAASGGGFGSLLLNVDNEAHYLDALESVSAHSFGAIPLAQVDADRRFTDSMMSCRPAGRVAPLESNCTWVRQSLGELDSDMSSGDSGFGAQSFSLQFGGQREIGDGWFAGGSIAYETHAIDADRGLASFDGEGFVAGAYLKRQSGPWTITGGLSAGIGSWDTRRTILMGDRRFGAEGSTDLRHVGAHARVAYDVPFPNVYLRPQLALDATYVHMDGFTERGSSFAPDVESQDDLSVSVTPAIEIGANVDLGNGTWLRPFAKAGVIFHNGNDWRTSVRFAGGEGGFVSSTELPDTIAQFSAGLELTTTRGLGLTVGYDGQIGDDYEAHRGVVNLVYRF